MRIRYVIRSSAVFFMSLVLFGCATGINYNILEDYMKTGGCLPAAAYVEEMEEGYGSNTRLLFFLDSAMINMLCGNYEKSNEYFHRAEDLAEALWTKSVSKEAASFLINDYTIPYAGEDYERAFINLFSAINYLMLERHDDALVETRRLDANLSIFNQKYEKKNVYKEDAFGRYISAIIYEYVNNLDDAYIDYYKALKVFKDYKTDYGTPLPSIIAEDLLRTAEAVDRLDEVQSYIQDFGNIKRLTHREAKKLAKVVFIHFNGISPVKMEDRFFIPTKDGPITLAFPRYVVKPPFCRNNRIILESGSGYVETRTELVEDINGIAVKNLDDRRGRVIAKTIARAAAKQAAANAVTEDKAARELLNIVNMLIEKADTRSWRTLPGEIYLTRVFLPEGKHNLYIKQCKKEKTAIDSIDLKAGETRFILFKTMH